MRGGGDVAVLQRCRRHHLGYAIGKSSVCVQVDVTEWTEQSARTRVLTQMASVLGDGWTLELTDAC